MRFYRIAMSRAQTRWPQIDRDESKTGRTPNTRPYTTTTVHAISYTERPSAITRVLLSSGRSRLNVNRVLILLSPPVLLKRRFSRALSVDEERRNFHYLRALGTSFFLIFKTFSSNVPRGPSFGLSIGRLRRPSRSKL